MIRKRLGGCLLSTYFFNLENITRNNLRSFDLDKFTVTKNSSLESQSFLQFYDNRTGLVFLDETNTGVEEQKSTDDTEIDPILKTSSKNGGSLDRKRHVSDEFQTNVFRWRAACDRVATRADPPL